MSNQPHNTQPPSAGSHSSRRAWWLHPKVALALSLLALILAPFSYRGYRIASVPKIGDPFDVAAFEAAEILASDNATEIYAAANSMRVSRSSNDDPERVFENGWGEATISLQQLLTVNERALDEWRRATDRPTAQFVTPKELRIDSQLPLVDGLREFSRLARLRAELCLHEGDVEDAWRWLRACVRSSRHLGQHGPSNERLVGIEMFNIAAQGINRWAADPRVDEAHLQAAAEQFDADDAMTPQTSVGLKSEYVSLLRSIDNDLPLTELRVISTIRNVPVRARFLFMFVIGEPEYSRRLMQHVFAGFLEQVDLPKWKRSPKVTVALGLYPPAPTAGRRLSAPVLESRVLSSCLTRALMPALNYLEEAADREAARRAALKLMFASQRYQRLHGDWPETLDDLVPDLLKELSADPFGNAGETLKMKRDGDDLIIYSLGLSLDKAGAVNHAGTYELPERYRLKHPER